MPTVTCDLSPRNWHSFGRLGGGEVLRQNVSQSMYSGVRINLLDSLTVVIWLRHVTAFARNYDSCLHILCY